MLFRIALSVFIILSLLPHAWADERPKQKVVVLYSHDRLLPANVKIDAALRSALEERADLKIETHSEFLDVASFPSPDRDSAWEDYLRSRYTSDAPRAIIAVGDPALRFFENRRKTLFPGIPLVVIGITPQNEQLLDNDPSATGILQSFQVGSTVDVMMALRPGLRKLVIVAGASNFDDLWTPAVSSEILRLEGKVAVDYWKGLPLPELLSKSSSLPDDAAILYLTYLRSPDGSSLSPQKVAADLSQSASVPVFAVYESYLGTGVVGGKVNDPAAYGRAAAKALHRIIDGEPIQQIGRLPPPPQRFAFDARQLKRWQISRRSLPKDSDVRFATKNVWQAYPKAMTAVTIGVLIQSALITGFLLNHIRRKRVEAALKQSENRYRQVLESQRDMVCRYTEGAVLTFVNDAYCQYFGKSREDLIGKSFFDLIPTDRHDDVRSKLRGLIDDMQTIVHEHQVVRPDGSVGWMQWEDYPILDDRGTIAELQGIGRDITHRRRMVDDLRQSEERFAGIFHGSPAAIGIIRQSDGRLVEVNPSWEKFFGINRSDAIGSTLSEIGLLNHSKSEKRFHLFLNSGKSLEGFEQKLVTPEGHVRWMSLSCKLVTLEGEPCYIVMSKDITGQKEAEDARLSLAKATKLAILGELTASIAHEVNQPLGAILSNADTADILLRKESPPIPEILQILTDIRRDDMRASEIIKRVRSMVNKHEVRMTPVDLNEILKDVEDLISHDIHRNGIKVVRELAADLPVVNADRIQIEQVMMNLVLNAIDALNAVPPNLRWIIIRSSIGLSNSVEASVEDSGPGIKEDALPRIFDSFFTTKDSGMGLGLALSRSIAEAHGGGLAAENNSHGGATLRLILPISHN